MFSTSFPRGFINNAVPQFFASQSLSGSTSRCDYQTVQPIIHQHKKPKNQLMCTLSSFPFLQRKHIHKFFHARACGPVPRSTYVSLLMQQNEETAQRKTKEEEVMRCAGGGGISPPGLSNYL